MPAPRTLQSLCFATALAACGQPPTPESEPVEISPTDFVVFDCGSQRAAPCAVLSAGGKQIVFGAPAGAIADLQSVDLARLDALMLFSLAAESIEGVDEIRNASWRAGRLDPLRLAGPEGVAAFAAGVDAAFQAADALAVIDAPPPGGFDAAPLAPVTGRRAGQWRAFDTGDLTIDVQAAAGGRAEYLVIYEGEALGVGACGLAVGRWPGCLGDGADHPWPLGEVFFVDRSEP
ncbi:MAG: hypothetical protein AAFX03_12590 [Pseudomonadota bacterium]